MKNLDKRRFSILVVDDNKDNLKVVSSFLKHQGYQIALSMDADDAMNILLEHTIDLILLDVMMPGTDGFTLCKKLKADARLKEIPVIFLTAKTETSDLVTGFSVGGVDYITKPFQKEELIVRVNNHIALAHAKKEILKQSEQIQRINLTKDRLYSIIAHDIKSPFSNISMLISTLAEGYLEAGSEEYDEILQSINNSSQETYTLLENLLQWTKSQTGDLDLVPETVALGDLIKNVFRFLEVNAKKKKIDLKKKISDDLTIEVDRNMIQSVMQNLIGNAIKFTHEGGEVLVSAAQQHKNVLIVVRDNGIGITEENIQKLFAEDVQLTTRGTNDEKGSGLGLLLVKDFIQRHKGTIDVESHPGKGTVFHIIIPVSVS